ncbi:MAG: RepB family plasmid replication initiator protein [Bacteroidetes bacterium]|nr:RepB family plasmid replication initiator protein [Bacteroidota bacterium]
MQSLEPINGATHLVTQHNALIRAKYNYTHREIKVTRLITSKVNPFSDYTPGHSLVVEIDPIEAKRIFSEEGTKYNSVWQDFRNTVASLNKKPIQVNTSQVEGDIYWTQSCVRDKKTGRFKVRMTEDIIPLIAALKGGNFTTVPLALYSQFKSKYLCRLYEILYSFRSMRGGEVVYKKWEELAAQTGWEGARYSHFKNRVLLEGERIFKERTPLICEITEIKKRGSRSVEGLQIKITTQNPHKPSDISLFPELSEDYDQAIKEIRYQLTAWLVSEIMIEKLLQNPFQFIEDEEVRAETQKKYRNKIDYLWEKMQYVAQAKSVKDEAKYLMTAIKKNYTSKQQLKEKLSAAKKAFHEQQAADLAALEQQVAAIKNRITLLRIEVGKELLHRNPEIKKEVFAEAAKKYAKDKNEQTLDEYFGNTNFFTFDVLGQLQNKLPDKFEAINNAENEQLKLCKEKIQKVKSRVFKV